MAPAKRDNVETPEAAFAAKSFAAAANPVGYAEAERSETTTGRLLRAARLASGRTIDDIADETRVPLRHLEAIEADEHDALPALPYALGFVRSFARAVDLDPETVTGRFRLETNKQPHSPRPSTLEPIDERRLPERGVVIITLLALSGVVAGLSAWGAGVFDPPAPDVPFITAAAPDFQARVAPRPPTLSVKNQKMPTVGAVVITATEDVWVRIYDPASALVLISKVMQAGERFEVPADPPGLLLWTGKAGALEVRIGELLLPPLGKSAQTLRDIALTPDALRARSTAAFDADVAKAAPGQE